jgi:outer membrane receptor protein involved in Fe transport
MRTAACFVAAILALWALGVPRGLAQDQELDHLSRDAQAPQRRVVEEIVVTAERREGRLRDVPISMSVLGAEFLRQQSIVDFENLARYVPNVRFGGSTQQISPTIRGFGSPADVLQPKSFEQAVSLVIDGVPYSRSQYFQTALFDLDQLEVLRGPQGTLFGKNASVGLFNLSTKDPTDEFTGQLDIQLGELKRRRFEAGIGGPLIPDFLNFRVAGLSDEQDGFMKNTTARVDPFATERTAARDLAAVRLKLEFPDLLGAQLRLSYERFETRFTGKNIESRRVSENARAFYLEYDPQADFEPGNFVGSIDSLNPVKNDIDTFVASGGYDLGGWSLEGHAGWTVLDVFTSGDSDNGPAPSTESIFTERTPQLSIEGLIHSPTLSGFFGLDSFLGHPLGSTDFTVGVLYQRQRIDPIGLLVRVNQPVTTQLVAFEQFGPAASPSPPGPRGFAENPEDDPPTIESNRRRVQQTSNVVAGFGQFDWHFSDRWTLLYGMRLQSESKKAQWNNRLSDNAVILPAAGFESFTAELDRTDVEFAPKVGLKFGWTDDFHFFATRSRGFRAGGFNSSAANDNDPRQLVFDPESVVSWDLGAKTELLGGTARLDLTLFHMNLTDFQQNAEIPVGIFQTPAVQNIGEVRARGIEADGDWVLTDWLTLRGALGFNDTEAIEFPLGLCENDRENTDGDDNPRCDLSGGPLPFAPKWTVTVTPQVTYPLSLLPGLRGRSPAFLGGIELTGALNVEWQDTHYVRETLDPRARQDSFFRLDANIGLANPDRGWDLRFTVDNLTNESVPGFINNVVVLTDTFVQFLNPPRLMFGSFRWSF